jgi:hypothetical protein
VGNDRHFVSRQKLLGKDGSVRQDIVMVKVRGDVFARFYAVTAKLRSRIRNPQFGLLGLVLRATTTSV